MGAAVCTAADIASAAAIPTSATRRRASAAAHVSVGKEGIFLVPSRVTEWELMLFGLKCMQPFLTFFLSSWLMDLW